MLYKRFKGRTSTKMKFEVMNRHSSIDKSLLLELKLKDVNHVWTMGGYVDFNGLNERNVNGWTWLVAFLLTQCSRREVKMILKEEKLFLFA